MFEFQVLKFQGLTTLAPLTPRASAWLDFHDLQVIMDRAKPITAGGLSLEAAFTQLMAADLKAEQERQ